MEISKFLKLDSSQAALESFYTAQHGLAPSTPESLGKYGDTFFQAMINHFNTAGAITVLAELRRDINQKGQ